ncbi:hypothetical protein KAK07_14300 [Ideonella sp. 4Y16]|uniref:hypothetical protein n=1 Tax=Ideonella alba TaxID=2824118 RepID=UPI001B3585EF|nr:hypothetical protein [Ideonella alba]MBQ0944505.1 hypothetical protein [Ideonella alba]
MHSCTRLFATAFFALTTIAVQAQTDTCQALAGRTQCLTLNFSNGWSSVSYTATFGPNGAFTLADGSDTTGGRYTCYGAGMTDVRFPLFGVEPMSLYGLAGKNGKTIKGYGKQLDLLYMVTFSTQPGACPANL